ncbi:hypothetical protein DL95DRAFT_490845 [Leptodontidium sp. 2 PMI_412]|nr:hypothetical protein DL95DRAFT_490845 [Leptodontidium sp. 2 PMI_412]
MPRKRRARSEDDDLINVSHERSHKHIKAKTHDENPRSQNASFPTVILSGFTWNMDVDARISRALDPYDPVFMEVSLELAATEKLGIKYKYGIQTDFVKVVCGSAESRDRLVMDLDHARFTWTQPFLEARKFEMEVEDEDSGDRVNTQLPVHPSPLERASTINPEQDRREAQAKVWIKLSEAITNARAHLFGDDLDTFEALIAKPVPGVDPMERVNRWIRGGIPEPQPQRMNMGIPRIKMEDVEDADANKENITMDDEMTNMGVSFGRTDFTPWW